MGANYATIAYLFMYLANPVFIFRTVLFTVMYLSTYLVSTIRNNSGMPRLDAFQKVSQEVSSFSTLIQRMIVPLIIFLIRLR